ncbi:protein kinase domain-containing protein [Oscillatoria salina]|uniref:protein kinase domain-containing protein n=1 Tax=Oscillatoria salina TaxID=331517 RepID=UPI001CCFAF03|nr:DUF1997 domain-containing protein [Oscillatoria salina]MBZ8179344.1 DUF1997 domain-containing protein [Oscillatoria salina IIICB1]
MSYCLNPNCPKPQNPHQNKFCQNCGTKLLLAERYRAIKPLGGGGFGRTFLARDEYKPSQPHCAIKQFYPQSQGTSNPQKAAILFHQEAERLEALGKHPQIPELLAHFEQEQRLYIIQEFIEGQNLAQELTETGAFNESKIKNLLRDLLPVLQFIHSEKIIHRDIKPENIIRRQVYSHSSLAEEKGNLVLVDFGAAKYLNPVNFAKTGTQIGSASYVAPEQSFGKAIFASDIFSLGVTCIHLLTNVEPFDLYDALESELIWRHYLVANPVSKELANLLDKMIKMNIKQRYKFVGEVMKDLENLDKQNDIQIEGNKPKVRVALGNKIKAFSSTVSSKVSEAIALDWTRFHLYYEDSIKLYAPKARVAEYLTQHNSWFPRCATPMQVSPMGANAYDLLIGRYGAFNYEQEVRIGLELVPPDDRGIYRISTIPLADYTPPGYEVDFQGSFYLQEVPFEGTKFTFPESSNAAIPAVFTQWIWQLNLEVAVQFPGFIRNMPATIVESTGDRLLRQIVRQVSRRLARKVQKDFHTSVGIPLPKEIT